MYKYGNTPGTELAGMAFANMVEKHRELSAKYQTMTRAELNAEILSADKADDLARLNAALEVFRARFN